MLGRNYVALQNVKICLGSSMKGTNGIVMSDRKK